MGKLINNGIGTRLSHIPEQANDVAWTACSGQGKGSFRDLIEILSPFFSNPLFSGLFIHAILWCEKGLEVNERAAQER